MAEPLNPVIQAFREQHQSAQINASSSFEYDPDKAARAYDLEQRTGVPSSFIFNEGDVEEFENIQKQRAVRDLINANPRIGEFVNSHPMAGKMARDDYGNLDYFSQKYDEYHKTSSAPGAFVRSAAKGVLPMVGSLPAIGAGAQIGAGIGAVIGGPGAPLTAAAGGIIGGAIGGLGGSYALSLAQDWFLDQLPESILQSIGFDKEQARMDIAEHGTASFLGSLAPFLLAMRPGALPTRELPATASALERVLNKPITQRAISGAATGGFEAGMQAYKGEFDLSHVAMAGAFGAIAAKNTAFGEAALAAGTRTAERVLPFLRSGKEPPYGLDPVVDGLYKEQAKEQAKKLDELFDAAQKIELRDKNPDFIRTHFMKLFPEASIEIDARAAEKLYGEGKRPEKGDNLLGWVPDIEQQWDMAVASSGRITVPLDHWLAYANKEKVADPLHDFIATKPGRPTLEEIKAPTVEDTVVKPPVLRPAHLYEDGTVAVGKPGDLHFDIVDERYIGKPPEQRFKEIKDVGFVTPDGKYLTREEALDWVKQNEKDIKPPLGRYLDAKEYREASSVPREKITLTGDSAVDALRKQAGLEPLFGEPKDWTVAETGGPMAAWEAGIRQREGFYKAADLTPGQMTATAGGAYSKHPTIGTLTVRQALDHMDTLATNLRGVPAQLYEFFGKRLRESVGDVKIHIVTQEELNKIYKGKRDNTPAFYEPDFHEITISSALLADDPRYVAKVLMHEMGHAFTSRVIGTDSRIARDIKAIMKEMENGLRLVEPGALKEFEYAFTKPSEFMAETWGNAKFQEALAQIPMSPQLAEALGMKGKGSLWDAIIRKIGDLMERLWGIRPDNSILDGLLKVNERIGERHAESPEFLLPSEQFMQGRKWQYEAAEPKPLREIEVRIRQLEYDRKLAKDRGEDVEGESYASVRNEIKRLREELRGQGEPGSKMAPAKQLELPEVGTTRMEDMPPFKSFVGMTQGQVMKYIDSARAMWADLKAGALEKTIKDEQRRQGKEWIQNEAYFRQEITKRVQQRPDIAADMLFRYGRLGDMNLPKPPKINAKSLTDEQAAALPKSWVVKRGGLHVDDAAGLFGYTSGEAMVERVAALHKGLEEGKMRLPTYIEQVVDKETKEHMEATYGDMKQNAINEAYDRVLSDHQENFMHEQVQAVAEKAKLEYPITKEQLKAAVEADMRDLKMEHVDKEKFLADASRAGKAMERAAQEGPKQDWAEAFRQSQAQQLALLRAREARKYEKISERLDKRMDKHRKRVVTGEEPEFTNFMHLMMLRLGETVNRTVPDLEKEIAKGPHKNLTDFIGYWQDKQLRDLHIPDWMLTPGPVRPRSELTAAEMVQVNNAFTAMEHNARDLMTLWKAGEKAAKEETIKEMVEKIASLGPPKEFRIDLPKDAPRKTIIDYAKSYWWSGINIETMLNRIDRNDPHGIMFRTIVSEYTRAIDSREAMIKEYQKKLTEVSIIPDMDKKVTNNLFVDPNTGEFFQMRKRNVMGILQNWGNESNRRKLSEGYGLKVEDVESWLLANTTKEDWVRAQKIGDLFKELFEKADNMSRELSGVGIEGLDLKPFQNVHGTFEGWYNPVKYDAVRPGSSKALLGPEASIESEYFRATTPQGYTKERTGYIAPMELNLDMIPVRMRQMIHDINIRPTIHQLSKIFYDSNFKRAMIAHYGRHQAEMFIPFLNDLANSANHKSMAQYMGNTALEYFRQNTIATLIGFNPSTVMKHGPTAALNSIIDDPIGWTREFMSLVAKDDKTGVTNWRMAFEKSELLQRRMRLHFKQFITGREAELHLAKQSYRDFMIAAGATPVAMSDIITAVPSFLNAYKRALARGESEGFAIELGNRAVRRTHGDSILTNRPEIMRTNALGAWFSSLYGFFSHMQQRQYEMAWKSKDILRDTFGKGSGDAEKASRHAPDILKGLMSYVIFPAAVEELVTPYIGAEKDSWGVKAGKALAMGLSSSWIGVRDFTRAVINWRDPQAGLVGTSYKALTDVARDLSRGKQALNREHAGNLIKHTAALTGVLTGLTNAQEGRSAQFLYRYSQGLERPKGPWGALVGLRYGTLDKHPRTFDEWLKHLVH